MPSVVQPSFAKGEISPSLYGRTDTAAYQIALRTARNFIVRPYGGADNRSGYQFIGPCKAHTTAVRIIDFQFKVADSYIIELSNLAMRFIRDDAYVTETPITSGITTTAANPIVVSKTSHGYSNGDEIIFSVFQEMTRLNGNRYVVANKTSNTFELTSQVDGTNIDGTATGWTAETTNGTMAKIYQISSPYAAADLFRIKYTQSADVMTLTHASYTVRELTRTDHNAWTLTEPAFEPVQDHPTGIAASPDVGSDQTEIYAVTAIANETFEESLTALNSSTQKTITGATTANPVVITTATHVFLTGDEIEINSCTEMTELNGRRFTITKLSGTTFSLQDEDGTDGRTAESSSTGTANQTQVELTTSNATPKNTVTWTAVTGAQKYAVYRDKNGIFGLIGETSNVTFLDDNFAPDTSLSPPTFRNPFGVANKYPGTVSYFEQRRVFGGSIADPDTAFYSQTGNTSNFTRSDPQQADDAVTATLSASKVNEIRHFVAGNDLIVLTSGAEWRINSGGEARFSADTISQKPQSTWGSSHRQPIVIGNITLYIQENDSNIRSIGYSLSLDGYTGSDLHLLSSHLIEGKTISDWTLVHDRYLVLSVRSDGDMIVLTFQPDQEVIAWTRWDTNGKFKSVSTIGHISDTFEDRSYAVIERTVDGNTVQYLEKVHTRIITDIRDCFFVDSGLSLDVPKTITGSSKADPVVITSASHGFSDGDEIDISDITWVENVDSFDGVSQPAQLNNRRYIIVDKTSGAYTLIKKEGNIHISAITQANPGVVTASAHGLSNGDIIGMSGIGGMTEANNNIYKVAGKTTNTFELNTVGDANINTSGFTPYTGSGSVYHAEDGSAFNAYVEGGKGRVAVTSITGLDHLEGEAVQVLADGNYISGHTVANGKITLTDKASRVHVGLKYVCDLETLDLETDKGTIIDKKKKVSSVVVKFDKSRGMFIGPDFDNLIEMKQREFEKYGSPTELLTGVKEIKILPRWNNNGRIAIRQRYPLPLSILAIAPDLVMGDE